MRREYLEILQKISPDFSEEKIAIMIENHYIEEYGSREKAITYFKTNNKNPIDEYVKGLDIGFLEKIFDKISKFQNFTELLNISSFKEVSNSDKEFFIRNLKKIKSLEPEITSTLGLTESRIKVSLIPFLESKLKLSLSKTREELGYPDQRTFNKWLKVFFNDKYLNRGKTNGRISLEEYIEIVSAFMLSYDEEDFGRSNLKELQNRFKNERSIHKKELKKYTDNNYYLLNKLLEKISIDKNLYLPDNYRKLPYSIASIFKSELNNNKS